MTRGKGSSERQLHRGHFAFMRALAQGLDERESWNRYLKPEGELTDARQVRRTIQWIKDAFAAAARREQRPGTARLMLLDPERFTSDAVVPSLEEFAAAQGLEDFSEAEQVEAFEAAHPGAGQRGRGREGAVSRRARVIARQLDALRWLETLVARQPRLSDGVGGWLNPAVAARLETCGLITLTDLTGHIQAHGARWWRAVPGVGVGKAARIVEWLRAHEGELGIVLGPHATQARRHLAPALLASVVPSGSRLVPYEKFESPAALDGRQGRLRGPAAGCRLAVDDDHGAIGVWLANSPGAGGALPNARWVPDGPVSATQRAYRREAERILLWANLEQGKALSSLGPDDAVAYQAFLAAPPSAWCGPRHGQRWSPQWRPLEGPLSAAARRQALLIVRSLFRFLVRQGYVVDNPFARAVPTLPPARAAGPRTITAAQWEWMQAQLALYSQTGQDPRLHRGLRWIQATGLRISELAAARCGDLRPPAGAAGMCAAPDTLSEWMLCVATESGRQRQVRVPTELVVELQRELGRPGVAVDLLHPDARWIPILANFDLPPPLRAWTASGFHQAFKRFLSQRCANQPDQGHLSRVSVHWLRHMEAPGDLAIANGSVSHE